MDTGGNGLVRELGVALRGDDRGVSENLLERRQRTAALQPPAGERVPELVGMEPGDPPVPAPHLACYQAERRNERTLMRSVSTTGRTSSTPSVTSASVLLRSGDELDFEGIGFVDVDHGSEVTAPQTTVCEFLLKNDDV